MHEGPVPAGPSLTELSALRAQYLGGAGYGNPLRIAREFQKRDAAIARWNEFDEVVLWFEHDLYDQLQLLQILHYFSGERVPLGRLQLIQSDDFLGMLAPEELLPLQNRRRPVNAATLQLAAQVWEAFRAAEPHELAGMQDHISSEMRHLHAALRRMLEEYPWSGTGLSRSQLQILAAVAEGAHTKDDLFRLSQLREEAAFLGDRPFFRIVDELCQGEGALLRVDAEGGFSLSEFGSAVFSGKNDWLERHALDRWIGGVHLTPANVWRWDPSSRTIQRAAD